MAKKSLSISNVKKGKWRDVELESATSSDLKRFDNRPSNWQENNNILKPSGSSGDTLSSWWKKLNSTTKSENTAAANKVRQETAAKNRSTAGKNESWLNEQLSKLGTVDAADDVNVYDATDATRRSRLGNVLAAGWQGYAANTSETFAQMLDPDLEDAVGGDQSLATLTYGDDYVDVPESVKKFWRSVTNALYGNSDTMSEEAEKSTVMAKDNLGIVGSMAVDAAIAGEQMALDAALGGLTHTSGLVPMAVRSFGGGAYEARDAGATKKQQMDYGALSAAVETGTELIGSVALPFKNVYGSGAVDDLVEGLAKAAKTQTGENAIRFIASFASEGGEEAISDLVNPLIKQATYDKEALAEYGTTEYWTQMLQDFLVGGVLGGLGGAAANIQTRSANAKTGAAVENTIGTAELFEYAQAAPEEAGAVAAKLAGTAKQNTQNAGRIYNAIRENEARTPGSINSLSFEEYQNRLNALQAQQQSAAQTEPIAQTAAQEATVTPQEAARADLASVSQTTQVTTQNGARDATQTLEANETGVSTDIAQEQSTELSSSVKSLSSRYGVTESAVQAVYDLQPTANAASFHASFAAAFEMGRNGSDATKLERLTSLSPVQARIAYDMGAEQRGSSSAESAAQADSSKAKSKTAEKSGTKTKSRSKVKRGTVTLKGVKDSELNKVQKDATRIISTWADATGVNVVLYRGRYKDSFGRFDKRNDTIYIDIDAGIFDEKDAAELSNYTMLRTFAHEFTHFVEKWNAERYNEFRAFVFEKMEANEEGIVDELIREYTDGGMDYDAATREVVAEGMTDILPDSTLVRELAEEHRSVFNKLLDKIQEFLDGVRTHYEGLTTARAREVQYLTDGERYLSEIVDMWTQIGKEASLNYQTALGSEQNAGEQLQRARRGRSIEQEAMENNRFERLRKYGDNLPAVEYAFTADYFYVYSNQSYMDYMVLKKLKINEKNAQEIYSSTEDIKNGNNQNNGNADSWASSVRSGAGFDERNSSNAGRRGTTARADGVDGVQRGRNASGDTAKGSGNYGSAVSQRISSAGTSIKQIPALFKNSNVKFGETNIDIGGGKFDLATDYLASIGTQNMVFDPYNRSEETNTETLRYLQDGNKADTATCANVLNVIAEPEARANVILEAAKAIKQDGAAYFMVYEGDGSGTGKRTSAGWQSNRKTAGYVGEIERYFDNVQRRGKLITATEPKTNLPKAAWETSPGNAVQYQTAKRYDSEETKANVKKAEAHFGTTYKINEAGYLLNDGKLLDFSGRHDGAPGGYRTVDHRDITEALGDDYGSEYGDYSGGMTRFMQEGNIRLSPEVGGINFAVAPNKAQRSTLDRYISSFRGEVILDIDNENGETIASVEYPRYTNSSVIFKDIDDYFEKGKVPESFDSGVQYQRAKKYDPETASVKEQLNNAREILNEMKPVATLNVPQNIQSKSTAADWAVERLKSTGYQVENAKLGKIYFTPKDINKAVRYADTAAEKAALAALPQVLKRGVEIGEHSQHKNRQKFTVTIAAPVVLNGIRGNVGVVISRHGNHYYTHRIVLPDGSAFVFNNKTDAERELQRGVRETASLADATSSASVGGNISQAKRNVNNKISDTEQEQQARRRLTNREVLEAASAEIETDKLTDAERDALQIFNKRLKKLEQKQEARRSCTERWNKGERGKAILDEMHRLDAQIETASEDLFKAETNPAMRKVLQKARGVVEGEERERARENVRRASERREEVRRKNRYKAEIQRNVDELSKWFGRVDPKKPTKRVSDDIQRAVADFIANIDFTSKSALAGRGETKNDVKNAERNKRLSKNVADLEKAAKNIQNDEGQSSSYYDLPPEFADELASLRDKITEMAMEHSDAYVINRMSADELRQLRDVVKNLKRAITTANAFQQNARFAHVSDAGENSVKFLRRFGKAKTRTGFGGANFNFVFWRNLRPAYGFERFGEGGKSIFRELMQGQNDLAMMSDEIIKFAEQTYTARQVKEWSKQILTVEVGGKEVKMTAAQAMGLYELYKRPAARRHLLGGGFRVGNFKAETSEKAEGKKSKDRLKKGHIIDNEGQTVTDDELNAIFRKLSDDQKAVADKLQGYMAKVGGKWGNEVSQARFETDQFGEETYYPMAVDKEGLSANVEETAGNVDLYTLLNKSFTKELNEKANNRLVVYDIFDVFSSHMAQMAQYRAFALPALDAVKWFNYHNEDANLRTAMRVAYGANKNGKGYAESFVRGVLKAINGTETISTDADVMGIKMLQYSNRAAVAYNVRVVIQQPTAIARASLILSHSSLTGAIPSTLAQLKASIKEMEEHSGIAKWKALGFYDVNISHGIQQLIKHDESTLDKVNEIGLIGAEWADKLTWAVMWNACKAEVRKRGAKESDADYTGKVNELFGEVIYKTQVVDGALTKTEFMRSKNFFARAVSSFMAEPSTTASMVTDAYFRCAMDVQSGMSRRAAIAKHKGSIGRTVSAYAVSAILVTLAESVADAWRDDDDYSTGWEKYLSAVKENGIDEILPFNLLPVYSDAYNAAKYFLEELGVDTYGYLPRQIYGEWIETLGKAIEITIDLTSGEDTGYTWWGAAYKYLQGVSSMVGIPIATLSREVVGVLNNVFGTSIKTYDPGAKNSVKYAYQDGNLTAEEAQELLQDEDVMGGDVMDADAAYLEVSKWQYDGATSVYAGVHDALDSGGNVKAAIQDMLNHGKTEAQVRSSVESHYRGDYKSGDAQTRSKIRQKLWSTGLYDSADDVNARCQGWLED